MKKFIIISGVIFLLGPVNAGSNDFSWSMFIPAITGTTPGVTPILTCADIAGCYEGAFTDSCSGTLMSGSLYLAVDSDCSFSSFSNYGVQASGAFTAGNGSIYTGSGQTEAGGCGAFSLTCTDTGAAIACSYTYSNGTTGSLPNASAGLCKPINRLKTEMLAGYWRFIYSGIYNNDYSLYINTVAESSSTPGEYYIYGEDQFGGFVYARYSPGMGRYDLYDYGAPSLPDQYYIFSFTGPNLVAGCNYQIYSEISWSSCYPLSGVRLY